MEDKGKAVEVGIGDRARVRGRDRAGAGKRGSEA
jgi:hypothetical protein